MKRTVHTVKVLVVVAAIWSLSIGISQGAGGKSSVPIPSGGLSLLPHDPIQAVHWYPEKDPRLAQIDIVEVQDMPFPRAIRIITGKEPPHPWDVRVGVNVPGPIDAGDVCLLSFFMRGTTLPVESSCVTIRACVEFARGPDDKLVYKQITAEDKWRRIYIPFRTKIALPAKSVRIVFHLGFLPQTVEIGGIDLLNFGSKVSLADLPVTRVTYRGRGSDARWRKDALDRIDKIRKAQLVVEVVDSRGLPVRDAHVQARMVHHAFGFGSAVVAGLLGVNIAHPEAIRDNLADYGGVNDIRTYRKMVEKLFNKATLENDLKVIPWIRGRSNRDSDYRRAWTDQALDWLVARGIAVRGHWIACGDLEELPREIIHSPLSRLRSYLFASMRERVEAVGNQVKEWDAINHIVGGAKTLENLFGSPNIYVDIMKEARNLAPGAQLWVNEGFVLAGAHRREPYEKVIRYLIDHAAAPDGIGFMGHFDHVSLTPPDELLRVFDRFARLIPRLQITELDVDVGDDELLQAEYLRDVMTAAFSHKACQGIVLWGFWENSHWKPDAALYRKDWSPKPSGQMWQDLLFRQWWTDAQGKTHRHGLYEFRGFLGQYEVQVVSGDRSAKVNTFLPKDGTKVMIVLH